VTLIRNTSTHLDMKQGQRFHRLRLHTPEEVPSLRCLYPILHSPVRISNLAQGIFFSRFASIAGIMQQPKVL